jgi:DNA replication protein DnaC
LAKPCKCTEVNKLKEQWKAAGLNPDWSTLTFNSFEIWNHWSRCIKETAVAYYQSFEDIRKSRKNSILFCGQVGGGKSHISIALALNFLKKGIGVVYMPYRDVITKIKQNIRDEEYYQREISRYQCCQVLLIDDIFKGKTTEFDLNIMFEILNYRYLNHLPIIVSTEFTVERLLRFDEGIGSRIYEMCKDFIVEIEGAVANNYRMREDR